LKIKNSLLILFIFLLSVVPTLAHKLMHETYDTSKKVAKAVYLDESTGSLIVQKYDLSDSDIVPPSFRFPKEVKSFGSIYHPVSNLRPEIKEEKTVIDLGMSSPAIQTELEKEMSLSREDGTEVMQKVNLDLYKNNKNKVISNGTGGPKSGFAIVSDMSGKLVFAKGMKQKSILPGRISFPQDLVDSLTSKSTKTIDISTPGNIEKSLNSLSSTMDKFDFSHKQKELIVDELNKKKQSLDKKISSMSLVKSTLVNGEKRELFFNFDDGSFYLRTSKNNVITDDEFYPLIDDKNLEDLKKKLNRLSLYNEKDFEETFDEFYISSCEGLEELSSLLPDLDSNIANILKVNDKVWGSYLENAVSNRPIVLEDGGMIVAVSALNDSHNLKIELGEDGRINKLQFLDKEKASKDGLQIKTINENGEKYFKVIAIDKFNNSEIDQFFFDVENDAKGDQNIAIYVRGNGENKEIYDKNTYGISLSGKKITSAKKRVHLSSSREDSYPTDVRRGSGQGVKTFFFKNFFSLEAKREKLADEVRSAVNSQIGSINKDGKEYLNKKEINSIILNIVGDVEKDIPKLSANISKITAKTYEHSYKNFVSNIVPKMISEIVPGESQDFYDEVTKTSMEGLDRCLEKSSSKSNEKAAEKCMDTYVKEAPVLIGMEVMKYQLIQNDQEALIDTTLSEYTKCIKEHYDLTEDMSFVKGCIFKAMFTAVDKDLEKLVSISLKKMQEDYKKNGKDIDLDISKNILTEARRDVRSCYKKKGYINPTKFKDNYNQKKLNSIETEEFKNDLLSCSSKIEQKVGRSVTSRLVSFELDAMDIEGEDKNQIRENTITKGYDNCIKIQNGIEERLSVKGEFYKVEAAKCTDLVTMTASDQVITNTLRDKLGKDVWDTLSKKDEAPHIMCFDDLRSSGRDELFGSTKEGQYFEQESARCLKKSVVWAAYYLGEKELSSIFKNDPLYRNVKLTKARKEFYAKKIQSCFEEQLKKYNSISSVSESLEDIQAQCTVSLVMSDEASKDILIPVVAGILEDSDVDSSIIDKTKSEIVEKMRKRVFTILSDKKLNLDEVVSEFKNIQGEATYIVANQTIKKYVHDLIPGSGADALANELEKTLFEGEHDYKQKLLTAKNKDEIDEVVNSITESAAIELTGHATRSEGLNLLEKGLLKSNDEVEMMASSASLTMEQCLKNRKPDQDLKVYLDQCVSEVKTSVTYDVFSDQLRGVLNGDDYASAFTDQERKEIYEKFINSEFRNDIDQAYKDDSLEKLQSKFTLSATSIIGEKVLKKSIADIYVGDIKESSPSYNEKIEDSAVVANKANNILQSCLVSSDASSDLCINKARLTATSLVFKDKIKPLFELLSNNFETQQELSNKEISKFEKCVNSNSTNTDEYTDIVNSCLIESIIELVPSFTERAEDTSVLLSELNENSRGKYNSCIQEEKSQLIATNQDSQLKTKISDGESFWIEYFRASSEDSQKRVDWAIETVQKCVLSNVLPELINTIGSSSELKNKLSLSKSEHEFSQSILKKIENFSRDTLEGGLWLKASEKVGKESSKEAEVKMINTYLDDYLPMLGDYLKKLHSYDDEGTKLYLDKFLNTLKGELQNKGELSLDEVKELLLESKLIDLIIESEISSFIKIEAKEPLSKEGVGSETIEKLGSKEIIGEIFNSEEGKKSISDIKNNFIRPMLNGVGAKEIPENIVKDVKHLLAKDTRMGGFVETLAGSIVQTNLEEKKPQNFATSGIASILGFDNKDFKWSNLRERKKEDTSDDEQPVKKAIEYFGDKILLPILLDEDLGTEIEKGIFNDTEVKVIDKRKEEFSGIVENLMKL